MSREVLEKPIPQEQTTNGHHLPTNGHSPEAVGLSIPIEPKVNGAHHLSNGEAPEKKPTETPLFQHLDLAVTVMGSKNGDERSQEILDGVLRPTVTRLFQATDPQNAEDHTQEALAKAFNNLSGFDPTRGKGEYRNTLFSWVLTIARNNLFDLKRRDKRKVQEVFLDDAGWGFVQPREDLPEMPYDITDQTVFNILDTEFPSLLAKHELRIARLKADGHSTENIAKLLGSSEGAVRTGLSKARTKIEQRILQPSEFKRLNITNPLSRALRSRRLRSIKILGHYYTTDRDLINYQRKKAEKSHSSGGADA